MKKKMNKYKIRRRRKLVVVIFFSYTISIIYILMYECFANKILWKDNRKNK